MHYYAFYHDYGVNMRYASDNSPVGTLHVFSSRRARNEWVRGERYEGGNVHREAIDCKEACSLMLKFAYGLGLFDPVFDDPTTDELVAVYLDFYDEI